MHEYDKFLVLSDFAEWKILFRKMCYKEKYL